MRKSTQGKSFKLNSCLTKCIILVFIQIYTPAFATSLTIISGHTIPDPVIVRLEEAAGASEHEWIGLFEVESNALKLWTYTDALVNAEFNLSERIILDNGISRSGNYEIRYFEKNSYIPSATTPLTVNHNRQPVITISAPPIEGKQLHLRTLHEVNNKYWIGLYNLNEPDNRKYIWWKNVGYPEQGEEFVGKILTASGEFELRLFDYSDVYNPVNSLPVRVRPSTRYNIYPVVQPVRKGEPITAKSNSDNITDGDWVGLYNAEEIDNRQYINWKWITKNNSLVEFPSVNTTGDYELRVFKNRGYNEISRTRFTVYADNESEAVIAFLGNTDWIQPQVYSLLETSQWPPTLIEEVVIESSHEILSVLDVTTGEELQFENRNGIYTISVPSFSFFTAIRVRYINSCGFNCNQLIALPSWIEEDLVNGYTALSAEHFYRTDRHGDAFVNGNLAMKDIGFSQITRMAKGHTSNFSTLWPSLAIIDQNGNFPLQEIEDAVQKYISDAETLGINTIAYYKDMGDFELAKSRPDLVCLDGDGNISNPNFTMMDFSSDWKEIALEQITELANRGVKGIYLDYIHMPNWGCFGTNLASQFTVDTGLALPVRNAFGHHWSTHPNWPDFINYQGKAVAETISYWKSEITKSHPEFVFIVSTAFISGLTSPIHANQIASVADMVKVEFDHGRKKGLRHKVFEKDMLHNQDLAKPSESTLTVMAHTIPRDYSSGTRFHSWAYGFSDSSQLKGFISSAIAMGGVPNIYIPEQYLSSDFNPDAYTPQYISQTPFEGLSDTIQYGIKLATEFSYKQPVPWAGVYFDEKRRNNYGTDYEAAWKSVIWPSVGAYSNLVSNGFPTIAVNEHSLSTRLPALSVVYFPYTENDMPEKLVQPIGEFTARGGTVIYKDPNLNWSNPQTHLQAAESFSIKLNNLEKKPPFRVIQTGDHNQELFSFFYSN